jgi:hypothetical protein
LVRSVRKTTTRPQFRTGDETSLVRAMRAGMILLNSFSCKPSVFVNCDRDSPLFFSSRIDAPRDGTSRGEAAGNVDEERAPVLKSTPIPEPGSRSPSSSCPASAPDQCRPPLRARRRPICARRTTSFQTWGVMRRGIGARTTDHTPSCGRLVAHRAGRSKQADAGARAKMIRGAAWRLQHHAAWSHALVLPGRLTVVKRLFKTWLAQRL